MNRWSHHKIKLLFGTVVLLVTQWVMAQPVNPANIYRAPLSSPPSTLDPAMTVDVYSIAVTTNIFDGLVGFDERLKVVPAIASIWKISRDQKTFTFNLRRDVTFHHGRQLTSADVVHSLERILRPDSHSPATPMLLDIKGAREFHDGKASSISGLSALSEHQIRIELLEPFAPFLSILASANAKIVPADLTDTQLHRHPIGTGPFKFKEWSDSDQIVLTGNDQYFAGPPEIAELHFQLYSGHGWNEIFGDFVAGKLEHAQIPRDHYSSIIDNPADYQIVTKPGLNIIYFGLNLRSGPMRDVRVRQALNYALNTDYVVSEITRSGSIPANGILPPGIPGFDPDYQAYAHHLESARNLLAQAGYTHGSELPELKIYTGTHRESVHRDIRAYQRYLDALDIRSELVIADSWKAMVKAIKRGEASLFYAGWYADYPDPDNFFYPLFHSDGQSNRTHYTNPIVDQLIEAGRSTTDYLARVTLYRKIEETVMRDAPIIPLQSNSTAYLFQSWVQGATTNRLGGTYFPYHQMSLDFHRKSAVSENQLVQIPIDPRPQRR